MTIFEIPVYALSPEQLNDRFERKKKALSEECTNKDCPTTITSLAIENETFPQRLWRYNHIVAYIAIHKNNDDIEFRQFLPHKPTKRYLWTSSKKYFLRDNLATGYHFRITADMTATAIRAKIHDYLDVISKPLYAKGWYIDREAFDTIDRIIDYSLLKY